MALPFGFTQHVHTKAQGGTRGCACRCHGLQLPRPLHSLLILLALSDTAILCESQSLCAPGCSKGLCLAQVLGPVRFGWHGVLYGCTQHVCATAQGCTRECACSCHGLQLARPLAQSFDLSGVFVMALLYRMHTACVRNSARWHQGIYMPLPWGCSCQGLCTVS